MPGGNRKTKKKRTVIVSQSSKAKSNDNSAPNTKVTAKSAKTKETIQTALMKHFLFKVLDQHSMDSLINVMTRKVMAPGDVVIKQGDAGDTFYVMEKGVVEIIIGGKTLGAIQSPSAFGELALMYSSPRAATLTCTDYGVLWVVDRENFKKTLAVAAQYGTIGKCDFLQQIPELAELSNMQVTRLAESISSSEYRDGEDILVQGVLGEYWYIIVEGAVLTRKRESSKDEYKDLLQLEEGDFFGELSLLRREPCSATYTASGSVTVYRLDAKQFTAQIISIKSVQNALVKAALSKEGDMKHKLESLAKGEKIETSKQRRKEKIIPRMPLSTVEILRTIGVGTMGKVKLVREKSGEQRVIAMKMFDKKSLVEQSQIANVLTERKAMSFMDHPFIINVLGTEMDKCSLYFFLELVQGGEVWSLLYEPLSTSPPKTHIGGFSNHCARWFVACVLLGLEHIHESMWIYRDIKLENLLVDSEGYIKIVDFGFAKKLPRGKKTRTLCGTPEYFAPELVLAKGHDKACDYWALGVVIYELLSGKTPFADADQSKIFMKIVQCMKSLEFPKGFPRKARDVVKGLLQMKPGSRLGMLRGGCGDILSARWFTGIHWETLKNRQYEAPWKPKLAGNEDISMFEKFDDEGIESEPYYGEDDVFDGFVVDAASS